MTRSGVIGRLLPEMERFLSRQVLGVEPDPGDWPVPEDVDRIPSPPGMVRGDEFGPAWILDSEKTKGPIRRRTLIGAQAYRFSVNREFDCGWRLANVAHRFLRSQVAEGFDLVTIIPPPPVHRPVDSLGWVSERLAREFGAAFAPGLILAAAPMAFHPDTVARPNIPLSEMFALDPGFPIPLNGRRVLLMDWRWHFGRCITMVARLLGKRGATVTRFTILA